MMMTNNTDRTQQTWQVAHKTQIFPNDAQGVYLNKCIGTARFAWNWTIAEWQSQYREHLAAKERGEDCPKPNGYGLKKHFNAIKDSLYPWMRDVFAKVSVPEILGVQKAFENYWAGHACRPKFHKRGSRESFSITGSGINEHYFDGKRFRMIMPRSYKGQCWIRMAEPLRYRGKVNSITISHRAGKWFISVQMEIDYCPRRVTAAEQVIGVDVGLKSLAVTSAGTDYPAPKSYAKSQVRRKRLQRQLSRNMEKNLARTGSRHSARCDKLKLKIAKLEYRTTNLRRHIQHQISNDVASTASAIVYEDLNVKGMLQNRKLAKSASDSGMSELRRQLKYKGEWAGAEIIVADRFFPSSKRCSGCGHVKEKLSLSERTYICEACGLTIDRDLNAALNLKWYGEQHLGLNQPEVTPGECALGSSESARKPRVKRTLKREPILNQYGREAESA